LDFDVGARLRAVRRQHRLSQRELARRAGVTNGSISLIESGHVSPSVAVLKRILDGIPLPVAAFFAEEPEPAAPRHFFRAAELREIGRGGVSYREVPSALPGRQLQILAERYQPGADSGRVMLSHRGEEGGIVMSGRLEVWVGEERQILGPGDAYQFESRLPHRFRNAGTEECIVISAGTPPSF
jgi:transcriptional regulator with XRE-family HTH domain